MNFRKDFVKQLVQAVSFKYDIGFFIQKADHLGIGPRSAPDGTSKEQIGEQVVSYYEKVPLPFGFPAHRVESAGFVVSEEQQIDGHVLRRLHHREFIEQDRIAFRFYLGIGHVDFRDAAYVKRDCCQRSIADNLVSRLEALFVVILASDLLHDAVDYAPRIRHRIMKLPSSDYDIHDFIFYFLRVVVGFDADLFEAGAFDMKPLYRHAKLFRVDFPVVVHSPR